MKGHDQKMLQNLIFIKFSETVTTMLKTCGDNIRVSEMI